MTSEQARINATTHGMSYLPEYHNWYKYKDHTGLTLEEYIQKQSQKCPECVLKLINGELVPMSRADATRLQKMRSDNRTGFYGVSFIKKRNNYRWDIMINGRKIGKAGFSTAEEAALDREWFIIDNSIRAKRNF
jgi:hypothetical protein